MSTWIILNETLLYLETFSLFFICINSQYNCCLSNIKQMKTLKKKEELYSCWQRANTPSRLPALHLGNHMSRTVKMPALAYIISTQHFLLRYFYLKISLCLVLMVFRTVSACDILQNRTPRREHYHILCGDRACLAADAAGMLFFYTRSKLFADIFSLIQVVHPGSFWSGVQ